MNVTNGTRSSLDTYMPWLIGLLAAFLAGKALRRMFWMAFAMYWAIRSMGVHGFY